MLSNRIEENHLRGKIFVLSAPSGAGKTTLVNIVRESFPMLTESISCTTRAPRDGEVEGVDYYFLQENEFRKKIEENYFVEHAEVHENLYGTPREEIERRLAGGEFIICDIDVQGALNMKKAFPDDSILVFILPPSMDELRSRLEKRGLDDQTVIERRLTNARKEIEYINHYRYAVVNNDLDEAVKLLSSILSAEIDGSILKNIDVINTFL